ncbi:MAG: Gfo/Idh/MocA family oxidoreductase [Anaerolineae bacterium]|nr:Gfo/Idh/MocA family oxidoreductase [Anaerolineae bacterium]
MKALFCGLGSIGQRHLRNLRGLLGDDVELLAYRQRGGGPVLNPDMTVRAGATLESTYNIRSFSNLDDALNEQPDIVFVTNPNTLHLPVALAAAKAGAHLFIEKPVSHSLEGLDELSALVKEKHLATFVAYQFRFHPGLQLLKKIIDWGELGHITGGHVVNGEYMPGWHPYEDYRETHPARRELGGGCLRIQTHELDYALWLFGMPRQVYAVGGHLSNLEVDVEDAVDVLMHCHHEGRALPVHIRLDYLQRPPQRVCEVIGDAGKAIYNYYTNEVETHDLATHKQTIHRFNDFDRNSMFVEELRHFLACVRGEEAPLVDLDEGIASLKITLAADESLHSGRAVAIA